MQKINEIIKKIHPLDNMGILRANERLDSLTKPRGSLGRLEDICKQIGGIRGEAQISLSNKNSKI